MIPDANYHQKVGYSFLLYLVIGGLGSGTYIVASTMLAIAGVRTWVASIVSYGVLVPIVFIAQKTIAFKSSVSNTQSFKRYVLLSLIHI